MLTLPEPAHDTWERFQREPVSTRYGDPVVARWARSRALGALEGKRGAGEAALDPRAVRERAAPILSRSEDMVASTAAELRRRGCALVLADRDGVILAVHGADVLEDAAVRDGLVLGSRWDEAARGTNGIGTALAERGPVAVIGRAHYDPAARGLVCYGAPIHDAFGEIVGVVDVSGPVRVADPLLALVTRSLAAAIASSLRAESLERASARDKAAIVHLLGAGNAAAMIVERPGVVSFATAECRRLLATSGARAQVDWARLLDAVNAGQPLAEVPGIAPDLTAHGEALLDAEGRPFAAIVHLGRRPSAFARSASHAEPLANHPAFGELFGDDPAMAEARARGSRLAASTAPVLLVAETGTGKEKMARALHAAGASSQGAFVAVDCAALPAAVLEMELLGYAPGAYPAGSARGSEGKFARAAGGTLFLDEIAKMPLALQATLLRVIQGGPYARVGETIERRASFRLVCASAQDLSRLAADGRFRGELLVRLEEGRIALPALRDRRDLVALAGRLLAIVAQERRIASPPALSLSARAELAARSWPGNVRELKAALRYALVMAEGASVIEAEHLPDAPAPASRRRSVDLAAGGGAEDARDADEATSVRRALARARGNVSAAARVLGVSRSTIYRLMDRHGIEDRKGRA